MKNRRVPVWGALLAALLLFVRWPLPARAAGAGSVRITLTDDADRPVSGVAVRLYRVGGADGSAEADFAGAEIDPASLLDERDSPANSALLAAWALAQDLPGTEQTTDGAGRTRFSGLDRGVYLVLCVPGQRLTFSPFLVYIPLTVGGAVRWQVEAYPKAEEPEPAPTPTPTPEPSPSPTGEPQPTPTPSDEPAPGPSDQPDPSPSPSEDTGSLPQTGTDPLPVYALLAVGALLAALGTAELVKSRRKRDE